MTHKLTLLATIAMMSIAGAAFAEGGPGGKKAEWQGLSNAEKLERIEQRRAEFRKKMDDKWNAMSDEEKLKHVEKKMEKREDHRHERREERKEHRPEKPAAQE